MSTIYRCLGGHIDEARELIDRDGLMRGEEGDAGMSAAPDSSSARRDHPAPGHLSYLATPMPSGAYIVSLRCDRCGVMHGFSAPEASAFAAIADWWAVHDGPHGPEAL